MKVLCSCTNCEYNCNGLCTLDVIKIELESACYPTCQDMEDTDDHT